MNNNNSENGFFFFEVYIIVIRCHFCTLTHMTQKQTKLLLCAVSGVLMSRMLQDVQDLAPELYLTYQSSLDSTSDFSFSAVVVQLH